MSLTPENVTGKFRFEVVKAHHKDLIFAWLIEPHMQEFWDNSPEHKEDIIIFINGRKRPSPYFDGIFTYWIGYVNEEPFCLLLTAEVKVDERCPEVWRENISKIGLTYSIDYGIGNRNYLGKGLAAPALKAFIDYFRQHVDRKADTFFIDPDSNNPRARHVYTKAGFTFVGEYQSEKAYWDFTGEKTYLMVMKCV
jgi:RimJ/RimL family protein N-acetyltransferase